MRNASSSLMKLTNYNFNEMTSKSLRILNF